MLVGHRHLEHQSVVEYLDQADPQMAGVAVCSQQAVDSFGVHGGDGTAADR